MSTLEENIRQAISDFDDIEAAIQQHGVEVPEGTDTKEYSRLIREELAKKGFLDDETLQKAIAEYFIAHPIEETDPNVPEWAKQPEKPTYTAGEVGALSSETLPEAVNQALAKAKESGEFDGATGKDGEDYVLTEADKREIAEIAAELVEVPGSGQNIELDTTLTVAGKAADSKAVGDALEKVDKPTDEQVSKAVDAFFGKNPPAAVSVDVDEEGTIVLTGGEYYENGNEVAY